MYNTSTTPVRKNKYCQNQANFYPSARGYRKYWPRQRFGNTNFEFTESIAPTVSNIYTGESENAGEK